MDCALTKAELVPYGFGEIEDDVRGRVERHLASCPACLGEFFALKRALESSGPRPSAAAHARLRDAVAQAVVRKQRASWSWWERPLAVGLATAAVVLATVATASLAAGPGAAPHGWTASSRP